MMPKRFGKVYVTEALFLFLRTVTPNTAAVWVGGGG